MYDDSREAVFYSLITNTYIFSLENERFARVNGHIVETRMKEVPRLNDRELFETYKEQVYRLCRYMMQNPSDAEDLCQEVFVKALLADRSQVRDLKSWLLRIASNECNSVLRRRKNGWAKELRAYLLARPRLGNPVEESADRHEIKAEFDRMYGKLPDKIRLAVTLRYANDMSVPEIAGVLGIPEGTVKSRLNRGIKLLQQMAAFQEKEMIGNESVF